MNNIVLVSGVQQSVSVTHIYVVYAFSNSFLI